MKLPRINSLYGRIFAIFWFTMLLVVITLLMLPSLDPRKTQDISQEEHQKLLMLKEELESTFTNESSLPAIFNAIEARSEPRRHKHKMPMPSPIKLFFTDLNNTILTTNTDVDFKLKILQNFITSIDSVDEPQQRLYGRFMIAGPVPITLADQQLLFYIGLRWEKSPPFLLQLLDRPFSLLLTVMLVSTPLLLWLAWALSQPARRLENAAKRVARGEFIVDPHLEKGTNEFKQAGTAFNQMVEAVNKMISGQQRLLSDISHELRSPLTRLRMANALATRKQGESSELTRIDTEAQRLEQMIDELLTLSRMQTDSHLNREMQPLSSLWEALLSDAQFEAEQMQKTLCYSAIPERTIFGTPKLLMSALENIIRNAIYYGKDQISVNFHADEQMLTIIVDDNGEGVPDNELNEIFRPFYRVSTARDRHSGGTGLGLAITESAIHQHSGTIHASRSSLGGLTITVTLPLPA